VITTSRRKTQFSFLSQKRKVLILFTLTLFFLSCNSNRNVPEFIFRVSLWANEDHTWYKAFDHFSKQINKRTEGRIEVEIYPSEQLAKEIESIRLIQADVIDMTVTASLLSNWIEIASFCEMPFLIRDTIDKNRLLHGPIGKRVKEDMLDELGLRPICFFERGPRHLTSNKPIRHPNDLDGMILRVPNVPSFVTAWNAMGAKPTPMAFSEVFTSLQQGTIAGQENPFALILNAGFAEVQKYVNLTEHVVSWSYVVIGEKQFQRLPEDLKTIFLEEAINMQEYEKQLFTKNETMVKDRLAEKGMKFIEVDKAAFSEKCEGAIYNSLSVEMKKLYQDFVSSRKG